MPIHWTRPALAAKVESLEEKHSGEDFVQAIVSFADTLERDDRKTLQDVLLERGRSEAHFGDVWRGRSR